MTGPGQPNSGVSRVCSGAECYNKFDLGPPYVSSIGTLSPVLRYSVQLGGRHDLIVQ